MRSVWGKPAAPRRGRIREAYTSSRIIDELLHLIWILQRVVHVVCVCVCLKLSAFPLPILFSSYVVISVCIDRGLYPCVVTGAFSHRLSAVGSRASVMMRYFHSIKASWPCLHLTLRCTNVLYHLSMPLNDLKANEIGEVELFLKMGAFSDFCDNFVTDSWLLTPSFTYHILKPLLAVYRPDSGPKIWKLKYWLWLVFQFVTSKWGVVQSGLFKRWNLIMSNGFWSND